MANCADHPNSVVQGRSELNSAAAAVRHTCQDNLCRALSCEQVLLCSSNQTVQRLFLTILPGLKHYDHNADWKPRKLGDNKKVQYAHLHTIEFAVFLLADTVTHIRCMQHPQHRWVANTLGYVHEHISSAQHIHSDWLQPQLPDGSAFALAQKGRTTCESAKQREPQYSPQKSMAKVFPIQSLADACGSTKVPMAVHA